MPRLIKLPRMPGWRRSSVAADVDAEIQAHLEERARLLMIQGLAPDAARTEALRRFGDLEATRRSMRGSAQRHEGRLRRQDMLTAIGQDARYTLRQLRRSPGLTAAIIVTLGLGIGATATMFGVVDRLLFRSPSHVRDPGSLGRLYVSRIDGADRSVTQSEVSYFRYRQLRDGAGGMADIAAMGEIPLIAGTGAAARRVSAAFVSANFWPLVGVQPAVGRFFGGDEERPPDGSPVVVLGHSYWQGALRGDSGVVGTTILLGSRLFTIIGVAPRDFHGVKPGRVDVWLPVTSIRARETGMSSDWYARNNFIWLEMVARMRARVTPAQVAAALTSAYRQSFLADAHDSTRVRERAHVAIGPLLQERGPQREEGTRVVGWLAVIAAIVLLLACANVANLLLARAIRRHREIAVRVALGVGRGRLLAQLLVEGLILAMIGATLGLAVAFASGRAVHLFFLPNVARGESVVDPRVLLFGVGAALVAGILAGLAPALHATRQDVSSMLRGWGRDSAPPRSRVRTALLVGQAALSTTLLVGAGLFIRSLQNARATELGFAARQLVVVRAELREAGAASGGKSAALYRLFAERLRATPGVLAAATTIQIPFSVSGSTSIFVPGLDSATVARLGDFRMNPVGPEYFETVGTRILQGRALAASDREGSPPVMVVSDSMARVLWPNETALGKCVKVGESTAPCSVVIGVAENIHQYELRAEPSLQYWFPESQKQGGNSGAFAVIARVGGDPSRMVPTVRRVLQPLAPGNAYLAISVVGDAVDRAMRPWRLGATVLTAFGVLGLCIAGMGLFSVLAYTVNQRTPELGLRMALGARTGNVLRIVVVEGVKLTLIGVAIGLVVTRIAGRSLASLLFGVSPGDPLVVGSVVVTLLAVALAASFVPAIRAARVDPAVALRAE